MVVKGARQLRITFAYLHEMKLKMLGYSPVIFLIAVVVYFSVKGLYAFSYEPDSRELFRVTWAEPSEEIPEPEVVFMSALERFLAGHGLGSSNEPPWFIRRTFSIQTPEEPEYDECYWFMLREEWSKWTCIRVREYDDERLLVGDLFVVRREFWVHERRNPHDFIRDVHHFVEFPGSEVTKGIEHVDY